ncbi:unnamed protein product, partial [Pleuronectes platessa]
NASKPHDCALQKREANLSMNHSIQRCNASPACETPVMRTESTGRCKTGTGFTEKYRNLLQLHATFRRKRRAGPMAAVSRVHTWIGLQLRREAEQLENHCARRNRVSADPRPLESGTRGGNQTRDFSEEQRGAASQP